MVGFESKLNRAPSVSMKVPVTNLLLVMNVIVTKMNVRGRLLNFKGPRKGGGGAFKR